VNPLVKVLRLVEGDAKLVMPYIYEAMDRAKEKIAKNFQKQETRYKKIWKIIDTRWNLQLHRSLHATTYYLNLKLHQFVLLSRTMFFVFINLFFIVLDMNMTKISIRIVRGWLVYRKHFKEWF